jgi:hypothetical protein
MDARRIGAGLSISIHRSAWKGNSPKFAPASDAQAIAKMPRTDFVPLCLSVLEYPSGTSSRGWVP